MDHIPKYAYLFLKFLSEMSQAVKLISNIQIVWIFENLITHKKILTIEIDLHCVVSMYWF